MSDFKAKMHKIRFPLTALPQTTVTGFKGAYFLREGRGREGKGREGRERGKEGEGKRRGREGRGRGEARPPNILA